jgi:fermentation-respiration switch protein FrsA (DUF1100 family)
MEKIMTAFLITATVFLLAALITALICFFKIFYSPKRKPATDGKIEIPVGDIYEVHRPQLEKWVIESRTKPHLDVEIKSFDGLTLRGKYYEYAKGAPIELMMHGYQGNGERDMSGGIYRSARLGHSALVIDHRASGRSDGKVISFGINESRDCISWINFILSDIDRDAKIILTGISMGASTALITSGKELPQNVVGVLADCGYTSAKDIIKKVIRDMKLPANVLYPFAKLGAKLFGGFDLDETSPIEAVKRSKLPTIFLHGDNDAFVPHYMSEENYEACAAPKKLVIIKGAGHGLAFPIDQELYIKEAKDFFEENIR